MVKKLLLALLLTCSLAHAEEWLEAPNKNGGKIILTKTKCSKYPALYFMLSTNPQGKSFTGCWTFMSGLVQVSYDDEGGIYTYDIDMFVLKDDK
jgi:hypothetical protein